MTAYSNAVAAGKWLFGLGTPGGAPVAAFTVTPATGPAASTVFAFDAGGSTPGGDPLRYLWDFGDTGPLVEGRTMTHAYVAAGTYNVRLYVQDNFGKGASHTTAVVVT
jgi:PKD repeat protein